MAQNRRQRRGTSTSTAHGTETKDQMIKALKAASYVIPVGIGLNALRLAYKGFKAGKKVSQLKKAADSAVSAAKKTQANAAKTIKSNATKRNKGTITQKQQQSRNAAAKDRVKKTDAKAVSKTKGANRAQAIKNRTVQKAAKTGGVAATAAVVGNAISRSQNKKPSVSKTPNTKPKGREGNIGRTDMSDFVPKQKKPNNTTTKKKRKHKEFGAMTDYMNAGFNRRK